jgi:hypothetical protein
MLQNERGIPLTNGPLRAPDVPGSKLFFPLLLHVFLPAIQAYLGTTAGITRAVPRLLYRRLARSNYAVVFLNLQGKEGTGGGAVG